MRACVHERERGKNGSEKRASERLFARSYASEVNNNPVFFRLPSLLLNAYKHTACTAKGKEGSINLRASICAPRKTFSSLHMDRRCNHIIKCKIDFSFERTAIKKNKDFNKISP